MTSVNMPRLWNVELQIATQFKRRERTERGAQPAVAVERQTRWAAHTIAFPNVPHGIQVSVRVNGGVTMLLSKQIADRA